MGSEMCIRDRPGNESYQKKAEEALPLRVRQAAEGQPQNVRTILVLGGELPAELLPLKNILGITVLEKVNSQQEAFLAVDA